MARPPLKYTDVMKPEDINIAHLWTLFAGAVLPADAPELQRSEMRKSFYAGFSECFKIMMDLTESVPEDQTAAVFERLSNEANAFAEKMIAEYKMESGAPR